MSDLTTKDLAIEALGVYDVHAYERTKIFHMKLGEELARAFAQAVSGKIGGRGEVDVVTELGCFEFCASHNTKNGAGSLVDSLRGQRVQATGRARQGYLSGEEFLELHGQDPANADTLRRQAMARALSLVSQGQRRLPV